MSKSKKKPKTLLELAEEIYDTVTWSHEQGERGDGILYLLRYLQFWSETNDLKNWPKL